MSGRNKTLSLLKTDPALILALICTGIYYAIILQPAMHDTALAKYTSEHAVEYVIVTLFFWGMIDIVIKLLSFPRQYLATRHNWLPARSGREPIAQAPELLAAVRNNPAWLLSSAIGRRLVDGLSFVVEKNSTDDYRDHLQHLADLDDQELQSKYTVLRFVIAVTPILGFLGTVVHFGAAIGSFSFEDMDAKLPEIVAGMGTAFNTTSVALATAMTMMFALFLCERVDQSIVATIDRLVDRELLNRFETKDASITPFLSVVQMANREALDAITASLQNQVKAWTQSLDTLFAHFQERQQQELTHEQAVFEALRKRHDEYEVARQDQLRLLIEQVDARQDKQWAQVQSALERATAFRDGIAELTHAMNSIARGEGRLIELQSSLADNLRVLQETSQIDSALHGLTAAIHLMTSRNRQIGIADSAAA